jgi:hypothetical protein
MPWWSWLVIWVCLTLALIAMLIVSAWRLFRKAMAVFTELGVLAEKTELLESVSAAAEEQTAQVAILQRLSDVQSRRRLVRDASRARRDARHRARLDRARSLTRFDASTREWFEAD